MGPRGVTSIGLMVRSPLGATAGVSNHGAAPILQDARLRKRFGGLRRMRAGKGIT